MTEFIKECKGCGTFHTKNNCPNCKSTLFILQGDESIKVIRDKYEKDFIPSIQKLRRKIL